jgi:hypothetical protein
MTMALTSRVDLRTEGTLIKDYRAGGGRASKPRGGVMGQHEVPQAQGEGLAARIYAVTLRHHGATIKRELDWQGRVEGNAARSNAFRDQALSQTTFRAFAFMKGKSPVVHMAHSIGHFFGMSGLALDVQGKHIGFIGDQVRGRHPVLFTLPPQNMWAWQKAKYVNNTATFTAY